MKCLDRLIELLCNERGENAPILQEDVKFEYFRALVNIRPPKSSNSEFLSLQNEYLQSELNKKGITDIDSLLPIRENIYLWQGDITTLKCDGIVNAANSQMLGCFCPNHGCIDNAIHTFAGIQLRYECAEIMAKQGCEEPTGGAKITKAYNLPCKYILHTVGPIARGKLTKECELLLASCYRSCLALADKYYLRSIAFCCISTGEFGFPNKRAAEIAVKEADDYIRKTQSKLKVIFNVFKECDYEIYARLLKANN